MRELKFLLLIALVSLLGFSNGACYAVFNKNYLLALLGFLNSKKDYKKELFDAIVKGYLNKVKILMDKQDPNVTFGCCYYNQRYCELLGEENRRFVLGFTPIHLAASLGRLQLLKYLVEEKKVDVNSVTSFDIQKTPLICASKEGHLGVVNYLIKKNADIEKKKKKGCGQNPLHVASEYGRASVVEALLRAGAKINERIDAIDGERAICYACNGGHFEVVKILVEHGAEINVKNFIGITPLYSAVDLERFDIVKYLIEHGAKIDKVSRNRAKENKNICKYLEYVLEFDNCEEIASFILKHKDSDMFADLIYMVLHRSIYLSKSAKDYSELCLALWRKIESDKIFMSRFIKNFNIYGDLSKDKYFRTLRTLLRELDASLDTSSALFKKVRDIKESLRNYGFRERLLHKLRGNSALKRDVVIRFAK